MDQFATWLRQHGVTLEVVLGTFLILLGTGGSVLGINWFLRRTLLSIEARLRPPYETVLTVTRVLSGAVWVCGLLIGTQFLGNRRRRYLDLAGQRRDGDRGRLPRILDDHQ